MFVVLNVFNVHTKLTHVSACSMNLLKKYTEYPLFSSNPKSIKALQCAKNFMHRKPHDGVMAPFQRMNGAGANQILSSVAPSLVKRVVVFDVMESEFVRKVFKGHVDHVVLGLDRIWGGDVNN